MSNFRLGAPCLNVRDMVYLSAILRMLCAVDNLRIEFVKEAPYDVLFLPVDADMVEFTQQESETLLLRYGSAEDLNNWQIAAKYELDSLLHYPFHSAQLKKRLHAAQQQLLSAVDIAQQDNALYKLKRWPPVDSLAGQRWRYRMTSAMCVNELSISGLVKIARRSEQEIRAYLQELLLEGLLVFRIAHESKEQTQNEALRKHETTEITDQAAAQKHTFVGGLSRYLQRILGTSSHTNLA